MQTGRLFAREHREHPLTVPSFASRRATVVRPCATSVIPRGLGARGLLLLLPLLVAGQEAAAESRTGPPPTGACCDARPGCEIQLLTEDACRMSGCTLRGCDTDLSTDCNAAVCGNGVREDPEECDGDDIGSCPESCSPFSCVCQPSVCGDNVQEGSEACDGTDDSACPGDCHPPGLVDECQCGGPATCGDAIRQGSEHCDGPDDALCPGLCQPAGPQDGCTCAGTCGDGIKEFIEECDFADDANCPGACQVDCTCPAKVCGNGIFEPQIGEECDGPDDARCPGRCRAAGDPQYPCTCTCGMDASPGPPTPPPAVTPEPGGAPKPRFIAFVVPAESMGQQTALRVTLSTLNHPRLCCTDSTGTSCSASRCAGDAQCTVSPNLTCAHGFAAGGQPNYSCFEGEARFVNSFSFPNPGGSLVCPDDLVPFSTTYKCATLGCAPEFRDWATDLAAVGSSESRCSNASHRACDDPGDCPAITENPPFAAACSNIDSRCLTDADCPQPGGVCGGVGTCGIHPGVIFVTGDVVLPSSTLRVEQVPNAPGCNENAAAAKLCAFASSPLDVATGAWGDVAGPPGAPPLGAYGLPDGVANVIDVAVIFYKFRAVPLVYPEPRLWLRREDPAPHMETINIIDVADCLNAVKGLPYSPPPSCERESLEACSHDTDPAGPGQTTCTPDTCP